MNISKYQQSLKTFMTDNNLNTNSQCMLSIVVLTIIHHLYKKRGIRQHAYHIAAGIQSLCESNQMDLFNVLLIDHLKYVKWMNIDVIQWVNISIQQVNCQIQFAILLAWMIGSHNTEIPERVKLFAQSYAELMKCETLESYMETKITVISHLITIDVNSQTMNEILNHYEESNDFPIIK